MDHSIVFSGRIRDGMTLEQVRDNFARLFKISDSGRLDQFFSGRPVVLKKNLSLEDATKYEAALLQAGAVCEVQRVTSTPAPKPTLDSLTLAPMETKSEPEPAAAPGSGSYGANTSASNTANPYAPNPAGTAARRMTPRVNTSGTPGATIPEDAAGLSWGGFFLNWIWGLCHGSLMGLLVFVPIIGLFVPFYYLFKGRQIAWEKRQWDSIEAFNTHQRYWSIAGVVVFVASILFIQHAMHKAQRFMAEAATKDPAQLQRMREEDLNQISDPVKREQMRKAYEQMDLGRVAASPTPSAERDQAREQLISQAPDDKSRDMMRQMYHQLDAINASRQH